MKIKDSLCSGVLSKLSRFCILLMVIGAFVLTVNAYKSPQNVIRGVPIIEMINSSSIEIKPLISNYRVNDGVIESINSPIFIGNITYASLSDDSIITPTMQVVINCESSGNHIDPKTGKITKGLAGELGIAQFMPATWEWFSKISGIYGDIYSEKDQLILMRWAFDNGYASHWSCYVKNFK